MNSYNNTNEIKEKSSVRNVNREKIEIVDSREEEINCYNVVTNVKSSQV